MSMRLGFLHRVTILAILLILQPCAFAAAEGWRAGAAKTSITPTTPMWMAGYSSRDRPAEGKATELWAKALVLEDAAGGRAVLITLDIVGIDRALSQSICGKLMERYGLKRDQIAINCSHTHSGPVIAGNLRPLHYALLPDDQKKLVDAYALVLEQKLLAELKMY